MKKKNQHNFSKFFLPSENCNYIEKNFNDIVKNTKKNKHIKNTQYSIHKKKKTNSVVLFKHKKNNLKKIKKIFSIITNFRYQGYKIGKLNPLKKKINKKKLLNFIFSKKKNIFLNDFKKSENLNKKNKSIKEIYKFFKKKYSNSIGFEYFHIDKSVERKWIQKRIEKKKKKFSVQQKKKILKDLILSEEFENYLDVHFLGSKRFSLEGSETLIPMLNYAVEFSAKKNIKNIVLGATHRGRLNLLANVFNVDIKDIFKKFSKEYFNLNINGDVKYHDGYFIRKKIDKKSINLYLKYNPSHLEIIHPIVNGSIRSLMDQENLDNNNIENKLNLPIIIHGDASVTGQGVVQEALNLSQTTGYTVGGSIHIVINNQIGFTTSEISDLRSTKNCTDIAKFIDSPIFHVNGDDPESALFVIKLSIKYKLLFHKDVFINLISYRRLGHNEVDDPFVTQPLMYKKIKKKRKISYLYNKKLVINNHINLNYRKKIKKKYIYKIGKEHNLLKKNFYIKQEEIKKKKVFTDKKSSLKKKKNTNNLKKIIEISKKIFFIPNDFNVHPIVLKTYLNRIKSIKKENGIDWGTAEALAYGNLLSLGFSCRISGEDIRRGTFFHRHAVLYNQIDNSTYCPLNNLASKKNQFQIWNSALSEEAVLAFEYGYSQMNLNCLTVWEAQFGDFCNVAQVVIDQFLCSGERKWGCKSNLVLFLPHGYEGQGPEHSSARIERFLQLSSENNIQVCVPSLPSQLYRFLCRQIVKKIHKPLVLITPKSLLRNHMSYSSLKEFKTINPKKIIVEIDKLEKKNIKRIIFCTGKIYFDLLKERRKKQQKQVLLIRIEQLYPFPKKKIKMFLHLYPNVQDIFWCQEEPKNQGAWMHIQSFLNKILYNMNKNKIVYIGRKESASTATGYLHMHLIEQKKIIKKALNVY